MSFRLAKGCEQQTFSPTIAVSLFRPTSTHVSLPFGLVPAPDFSQIGRYLGPYKCFVFRSRAKQRSPCISLALDLHALVLLNQPFAAIAFLSDVLRLVATLATSNPRFLGLEAENLKGARRGATWPGPAVCRPPFQ